MATEYLNGKYGNHCAIYADISILDFALRIAFAGVMRRRSVYRFSRRFNFNDGSGYRADLVILDRDIGRVPVKDLLKTTVLATYVRGEQVFGAINFE